MPHLVEHDGGALPGDAVLPVVVGGVHRGAAEHAGDGAGGIGAVIGDATPGGRGANVTSVVVGQEGLDAHKLLLGARAQRAAHRQQHSPVVTPPPTALLKRTAVQSCVLRTKTKRDGYPRKLQHKRPQDQERRASGWLSSTLQVTAQAPPHHLQSAIDACPSLHAALALGRAPIPPGCVPGWTQGRTQAGPRARLMRYPAAGRIPVAQQPREGPAARRHAGFQAYRPAVGAPRPHALQRPASVQKHRTRRPSLSGARALRGSPTLGNGGWLDRATGVCAGARPALRAALPPQTERHSRAHIPPLNASAVSPRPPRRAQHAAYREHHDAF